MPQNRVFFRFISSELMGISSELIGISSEFIAITSEIFRRKGHNFGINATKKRKVNIYIYLLLHPRVRTCVRERKFSREWKRNRLYPQEKREKKKLRRKEKSKKILYERPTCLARYKIFTFFVIFCLLHLRISKNVVSLHQETIKIKRYEKKKH